MYRNKDWDKGHYIDAHIKNQCADCGKEFITGEKLQEGCRVIHCPYCGSTDVEKTVWCDENEKLEELSNELGCLAIYVDEEN